jgi:hypothetical protein
VFEVVVGFDLTCVLFAHLVCQRRRAPE